MANVFAMFAHVFPSSSITICSIEKGGGVELLAVKHDTAIRPATITDNGTGDGSVA